MGPAPLEKDRIRVFLLCVLRMEQEGNHHVITMHCLSLQAYGMILKQASLQYRAVAGDGYDFPSMCSREG